MNKFSRSFLEMDSNVRLGVLAVYHGPGDHDILKMFVDSLSHFSNVSVFRLDWKSDCGIMSEKETLKRDLLERAARSLKCELVVLLGSKLRLDSPADDNSEITHAVYWMSTISGEESANMEFSHLSYVAHSYNTRGNFRWLPASFNSDVCSKVLEDNKRVSNGKVLCLWNHGLKKRAQRLKVLGEMRSRGVNHACFGSLTGNRISPLAAMREMLSCRIVLDDNRDGVCEHAQFNDRFAIASALGVPVISYPCQDLDRCFSSYLKIEAGSVIDFLPDDPEEFLDQNRKEAMDKHRNEFRWAEIIKDHLERVNKI